MGRILSFKQMHSVIPNVVIDGIMITGYEQEFLKAIATDTTYKEVAKAMNKGVRTLGTYRDALFYKLDIHTRLGLVLYAIKHKIVTIE